MNKKIVMGIVANALYIVIFSKSGREYAPALEAVLVVFILVSIIGAFMIAAGKRKAGAILVGAGCVPFVPLGLIGINGAQDVLKEGQAGFWSTRKPWIIEAVIVLPIMFSVGIIAGSSLQDLVDSKHPLLVRIKLAVSERDSMRDKIGSALYWASSHNDFEMVKLLIENGADVRHISFERLNTEIFKYVVEKGADPKNEPLEMIYNPEIVNYAVAKGADVNAHVDEQGNTRLMSAVENEAHRSTTMDVAIHSAKTDWNSDSPIRNLLTHGANVNAKNKDGRTALMMAFIGGTNFAGSIEQVRFTEKNKEIPLLLLDHGADINAKDNKGNTPLMYAMRNLTQLYEGDELNAEDLDVLSLLIARKANVNVANKEGSTPLRIAQSIPSPAARERVVAMLKKTGARE